MAYSTQEVTDRWKTGEIKGPWVDYIDDKSCGTGAYGLPEKEVEENDSGELSGNQPVRRVHHDAADLARSREARNRHRHAIEQTSRKI